MEKFRLLIIILSFSSMLFLSCNTSDRVENSKGSSVGLELLSSDQTGITFNNAIQESETVNHMYYNQIYSGAGVGIGDLNNDGALDVISISSSCIYYMEGNGSGLFDLNTSTYIDDNGSGTPDYALICDLDQDGDKDVLISLVSLSKIELYKNLGGLTVGEFDPSDPSTIINDSNRLAGKPEFFTVGDIDNDYDLDIIVAYQESNEVVWYANDGNSTFTEAGVITSVSSPRYLELIDANDSSSLGDHFKCPDIVIAGENGIFLAENAGKGVFTTSKIIDFLGQGEIVRAVNLDGNDFPDLVYATTLIGSPPSYSLQDSTGFSLPIVLPRNLDDDITRTISSPSAIEIYTGPFNPAGNYKGPTKSSPAIIVSDRAKKFISIYEYFIYVNCR